MIIKVLPGDKQISYRVTALSHQRLINFLEKPMSSKAPTINVKQSHNLACKTRICIQVHMYSVVLDSN